MVGKERLALVGLEGRMVADIIHVGRWDVPQTDDPILEELFVKNRNIQIGQVGEQDKIIWKLKDDGRFNYHQAWDLVRHHNIQVDWHFIWDNIIMCRYSICSWRALLGRLATSDNLQRQVIQGASKCVLCFRDEETINHIFFKCRFSMYIWERVCLINGRKADQAGLNLWEEAKKIKRESNGKQDIQKAWSCAFTVVIFSI